MIRRGDTSGAIIALSFAPYPLRQHLPFRIGARLPSPRAVVRVGTAAVGMQRLEQEAALLGIAGNDQARDGGEGTARLLIVPRLAVGRRWCEANQPRGVAIAALDVPGARCGEHRLHAGAKEIEIQRPIRRNGPRRALIRRGRL